jgi:hypothetical protein
MSFSFLLIILSSVIGVASAEEVQVTMPEPYTRSSSVTGDFTAGRDEYRQTSISASLGQSEALALILRLSRSTNAFTDAASSASAGIDLDEGGLNRLRFLGSFYSEPFDVRGVGGSLRSDWRISDLWKGSLLTQVGFDIQGTYYWEKDSATSTTGETEEEAEDSSGSGRGRGRGRGGSTSTILTSSGVWQLSTGAFVTQDLNSQISFDLSFRKYFYLVGALSDANTAISDRPFNTSNMAALVDGFPSWMAELSAFWSASEKVSVGVFLGLTRSRSTASNLLISPGVEGTLYFSRSWSGGLSIAKTITPSSTLSSLFLSYRW